MSAPLLVMAEGLGKRYRIGAPEPPSRGPLRAAGRWLWRPFARARAVLSGRLAQSSEAELWALRDISLTLSPGEVLGLVGPNGAGKTTLLRLLSGITRPTTGRLGIRGRVGSLLEVSIGFHPELTGRENIYLYGALLGLRRAEVRGRFDDIIAFSGVALMLDTPMKFFSSGMYARLAFAVASSLAPDLLLVDEVLSVSDLAFQQRSLSVIQERARAGAGVVFVSHNLNAMEAICSRCLLLDRGRILSEGSASEVLARYQAHLDASGPQGRQAPPPEARPGSGSARLTTVQWAPREPSDGPLALRVTLQRARCVGPLRVGLALFTPRSREALGSLWHELPGDDEPGETSALILLDPPPLTPGEYPLRLWLLGPQGELCDELAHGAPALVIPRHPDSQDYATQGALRLRSRIEPAPRGMP